MTPEQFAYWLHGFTELNGTTPPTAAQWKSICEHIDTVFKKVTPPVSEGEKLQEMLEIARERAQQSTIPPTPRTNWPPYKDQQKYFLDQSMSNLPANIC